MKRSDWPTLGELLGMGKRVIVFLDYNADPSVVDFILPEFQMVRGPVTECCSISNSKLSRRYGNRHSPLLTPSSHVKSIASQAIYRLKTTCTWSTTHSTKTYSATESSPYRISLQLIKQIPQLRPCSPLPFNWFRLIFLFLFYVWIGS